MRPRRAVTLHLARSRTYRVLTSSAPTDDEACNPAPIELHAIVRVASGRDLLPALARPRHAELLEQLREAASDEMAAEDYEDRQLDELRAASRFY